MAQTTQSWSVIIICYNEAGTIVAVINSAKEFFEKIGCRKCEIVLVDDGSTDGTRKLIQDISTVVPELKVVYHAKNLGIGATLRSGYSNISHENVCMVPGDGQFDLDELLPFADLNDKTFVSFYREVNTVYSFRRNILSLLNKKINQLLLGIRLKDVNWVKVYKRDELSKLNLKMTSSLVESEICAKLLLRKNKVIEVTSVYHARRSGVSKGASYKVVIQALRETLKLFGVISIYRFKSE